MLNTNGTTDSDSTSDSTRRSVIAGGAVSSDWIDMACRGPATTTSTSGASTTRPLDIANSTGHRQLKKWLRRDSPPARVTIEASGIYSLDVALARYETKQVELMVAHPKALKNYRGARQRRAKTDRVDARLICDFCQHMHFEPWSPTRRAAGPTSGAAGAPTRATAHQRLAWWGGPAGRSACLSAKRPSRRPSRRRWRPGPTRRPASAAGLHLRSSMSQTVFQS